MLDRPRGGERAILVHINFQAPQCQEDLAEFQLLASSAGVVAVDVLTAARDKPDPKLFVGVGKASEIRDCVTQQGVDVVLFNHDLTPGQQRNLERLFCCRVLDRTELILDIFAQRARTYEGKLQVELAQLEHLSSRLVRGWTHLERQKGGIGLRGPGETQLETDRRLIRVRINHIKNRLQKVRKQREQSRRSRKRAAISTVSLVGYTNAGKSTLFNLLTQADVFAEDQLFATLDPTLRRVMLPNFGEVILADTVGFIRHLPHTLVDAFRATLEEVCEADLLLHVIDNSDENYRFTDEQVQTVLTEIGADNIPQLKVYNKIDLIEGRQPEVCHDISGNITKVKVSAQQASGISLLLNALAEKLSNGMIKTVVHLAPTDSKLRARLYQLNSVINERVDENGDFFISIMMPRAQYQRLFHPQ